LSTVGPLEHRANLGERGARAHHRDEGGLFLKPLAKTDEEDVDELTIVDRITKFTEFVRDRLEALTVDTDG
jgi:hypothetical protein